MTFRIDKRDISAKDFKNYLIHQDINKYNSMQTS